MVCVEDRGFSKDYLDPDKRSIANAISIELNDGRRLDEVVVVADLRTGLEGL